MIRFSVSKNIKYHFVVMVMYIFVFQNYIENNVFQGFRYIDEILALILGCYFIVSLTKKKKIYPFSKITLIILFILLVLGIISTAINSFQPLTNVFLDVIAISKFPLALIGSMQLFEDINIEKESIRLFYHVKSIAFLFFVLTILDMLFNIFPDTGYQTYKHGIKSLRLIYGHPATLSVVCLFLFSILIFLRNFKSKGNVEMLLFIIIMILTFRAKILGSILVIMALYIFIFIFNSKITLSRLLLLTPAIIGLAWEEIQSYYVTNSHASRLMLTITSLKIARDYFPFGTGFATFASAFSLEPYSILYYRYGLSTIWGLSREASQDISDTFFPMILAELGVVALVFYIFFIYKLYRRIQLCRLNRYIYLACLTLFVYLVIASSSESAFVNAYSVYFAIYLSLYLKTFDNLKGESNENNIS